MEIELNSKIRKKIENAKSLKIEINDYDYKSMELNEDITLEKDASNINDSANLVMENGALNILHQWDKFSQFIIFCIHDRFHVMLSMNWVSLILLVFFVYIVIAIILAFILFILTSGEASECIGTDRFGKIEYFFFAIETMFSIGYGSPRSPTCLMSNCFTPIMVITCSILNSITVGIFFTKFSDSNSRKWAICFSKELCGIGFQDNLDYNNCKKNGNIRINGITNNNCPFVISFRLINITQEAFFSPKLKLFIILHSDTGLSIAEIKSFRIDVPLEFMETPVTITIYSNDIESPFNGLKLSDIRNQGQLFELMALLRFFDNRTSKNIEIRKTWKLSNVYWGYKFAPIIRKPINPDGTMYQVGISDLNNIEPVISDTAFY
ncbi:hypothetical protein FG386_001822 [Cryptosporidium ryanae]|uniref:uncharacterized protein n=1 Tax=Cryptosporidium ryanae TaxID=515981 RepID=UPI003519EB12|nr:hypothetical protein FG386_001822 [Cryptosporidium ryanae]